MIEYVVTVTTKEDIAKLDILTKSEAEAIIKSNIEKKNGMTIYRLAEGEW